MESKEHLEGFNAGYLIEKHRPELAKVMTASLEGVDEPFVEGFLAGSKESQAEKTQERSKGLSKLRDSIRSRGKMDRDRGKDMDR